MLRRRRAVWRITLAASSLAAATFAQGARAVSDSVADVLDIRSWHRSDWIASHAGERDGFYTLPQLEEWWGAVAAAHPGCCTRERVGSSVEGAEIAMFCTAARGAGVLLTALHHAREPLGMRVSMAAVEGVLDAAAGGDVEAISLLQRRQLCTVPVVNPDAYAWNVSPAHWPSQRMARKNRRPTCDGGRYEDVGVDLNRNYDFEWSHDDRGSSGQACAEDFRGPSAFSEPETRAVRDALHGRNFTVALNFHSFGRFINLPYMVQDLQSPPQHDYAVFLALAESYASVTGFDFGHPWAGGLYTVNGETSDWMYTAHGMFAMSPELGPQMNAEFQSGMWPAPDTLPALTTEGVRMVRQALLRADSFLAFPSARSPLQDTGRTPMQASVQRIGAASTRTHVTARVLNEGVRETFGEVVTMLIPSDARFSISNGTARSVSVDLLVRASTAPLTDGCTECSPCENAAVRTLQAGLLSMAGAARTVGGRRYLRSFSESRDRSGSTRVAAVAKELLQRNPARGMRQALAAELEARRNQEAPSAAEVASSSLWNGANVSWARVPALARMSASPTLTFEVTSHNDVCAQPGAVAAWLLAFDAAMCTVASVSCDGSVTVVAEALSSAAPVCAMLGNAAALTQVAASQVCQDLSASPQASVSPPSSASPVSELPASPSASPSASSPALPAATAPDTHAATPTWPWMHPTVLLPERQALTVVLAAILAFVGWNVAAVVRFRFGSRQGVQLLARRFSAVERRR